MLGILPFLIHLGMVIFFRFWGDETYERLLAIKKTWDPEMVFSCRHCVGDGETPGIVTKTTRPSWRFQNNK